MAQDPTTSIVITHGLWMHIRLTRVYHRHYPEVRGEGASPGDAATHLLNQLAHALDFTHGHQREAIERAIADVRRLRSAGPRRRPQPMATTS
jgi:hypothetical protein